MSPGFGGQPARAAPPVPPSIGRPPDLVLPAQPAHPPVSGPSLDDFFGNFTNTGKAPTRLSGYLIPGSSFYQVAENPNGFTEPQNEHGVKV